MTLKQYLILMFAASLLCWGGWFAVVVGVDPMSGGFVALVLFYASLGMALVGTLATLGTLIRSKLGPMDYAHVQVSRSFRQAIILAVLVLVALMLQSGGRLAWPQLVLLIGLAVVSEAFLSVFKAKNRV
jgi:hypothetical protein